MLMWMSFLTFMLLFLLKWIWFLAYDVFGSPRPNEYFTESRQETPLITDRFNALEQVKELSKQRKSYHEYEYTDFITTFTEVIEKLITQGKEVHLDKFGVFMPKFNKELTTLALREKTKVTYPSSVTLKFKPSAGMQKRIKMIIAAKPP